jgi:hypothetical protein
MRRYRIEAGGDVWDSAPNGLADPNALQVDLDVSVTSVDAPQNGSFVRIWGLGLKAISNAKKYYGQNIEVSGGFAKGLPLARPSQFGLLAKGIVTQAWGTWEGTNQYLDLAITPGGGVPCATGPNPMPPKNKLVLNWKKGQMLEEALKETLRSAFPEMQSEFNIQEQLKADQDNVHYASSLPQLGYYLRRLTQQMVGGRYPGVSLDPSSGKIDVFDYSKPSAKRIEFSDLIGSPIWQKPAELELKTAMRGDIKFGDRVTLPNVWVNSSQSGAPVGGFVDYAPSLGGEFVVQSIRHIGSSRAPSGDAWVSVFTLNPTIPPSDGDTCQSSSEGGL